MLRNARHTKILEIIEEKEIETQEELCEELSNCNFTVTQATVSRDIKDLHLFKVKGIKKRFRYAAATENEAGISDKMRALFKTCVTEIVPVGNLIVVKTLNVNAGNAGVVVERLNYREVVGVLAGNDTVLLICETPEKAQLIQHKLEMLIKG